MPLPPPVSALARQTIRTAYEDLERTITPADSRDFYLKTLQDVWIAALEIEKQLAARQSLCNMRRLMPLFRGLEHYSKVIDVLCNGTPYLPWIWAPITFILRVASEYVEAFEQVIKGYSRVAASLGRFEILSDAFIRDQDFQQTLAVFYADILQFHKHAYKFVRRSGWKLLFLTSWGRFQRRFDNILEDMKRHEALVDQEANARNIAEAQKMRQDIRTWREESVEQVGRLEEEQAAKQYQSIMSWLKMDESDQLAIFDSISAEGTKYPGTCGWTLKNPKVRSWLQRKPDTPILWFQGTPGSGKSVISTQLVNFMKAAKNFVIHHFCTYSYASSTMYDQILRSLLLQLLRKDGELVAHVYEECVLGKKSPTVSTLEQLLQTLFTSMSNEPCQTEYIWVILDGLDECEADKQARVVSLMNQITSKPSLSGGTICKVLISSRASPVLSNRLRKKQTISLTDEKDCLERAIRQYASQRLQSLHQKLCQLHVGPSEIEEIERRIAKKADGMFLYARLVLDYLATNIFYSGDEIKISVNQLPEKLTDFYRKILTQILIHLDPRSVDRIKCIFGWIAFAKRPLRKLEFLSALSFSSGNPEVAHLAPQYILDICGPLIEERRDTTLAFIHVSVKDFFQTSSSSLVINEQEALQEHGIATITCLLSGLEVFSKTYQEQTKYLRVVKGLHSFHVYATEYWTEYLLSHAVSAGGLDTNSSLFVLAYRLADRLEEAVNPTATKEVDSESRMLDERLTSLQQHAALHKQVEGALKARSLKQLESELLQEHVQDRKPRRSSNSPGLDGISAMLTSYQEAVRSLLSQSDYPGVSAEELELFKNQFRTSAFTCRLNSCPRATLGFESEKLRLEHEMAHVRRFRCTFPGCKYPPFVSAQSLTNHLNKYHNPNPPRKLIRQVGHIPTTRSGNAAPTNVAMEGSGAVQNGQPLAAPLQSAPLIRPEQVKELPFLDQEAKARHEVGIQKLWDIINTRPANSPEQQQAYARLVQFSATLMNGMKQWNTKAAQQAAQQAGQQNSTSTTSHGSSNATTFEQLNPVIQARVNATQFIYPPKMTEGQPNAENWLREVKARFGQALQRTEMAKQRKAELQRNLAARQQAGAATPEEINMFNTKIQQCQKAIAECDNFMIKFREQQQSFRQQAQQQFTAQGQPGPEDNHDQPVLANVPGNQPS